MGRLLRKKTSAKKKKRQDDGNLLSSETNNGETSVKTTAFANSPGRGNESLSRTAGRSTSGTHKKNLPPAGIRKYLGKGTRFLREVRAELKKVTWPSRKQTTASTIVVIVLVMIISLFLWVADMGLSSLVRTVLR
ncbi:preprotein translocase subunit SecE [Desulfonema magnum]|uniref:Protein translocase subunit SecE n=1 Tax=Desulfonema magnum TaxID=45655 RepID=A0A975BH93_9BACT|nr:preprotein translocase subunit SecE [Desulfonema magnum]QTA85356.1 Protein translocase subunit, SecE-like [Desulfonema magnum]